MFCWHIFGQAATQSQIIFSGILTWTHFLLFNNTFDFLPVKLQSPKKYATLLKFFIVLFVVLISNASVFSQRQPALIKHLFQVTLV